MHCKEVSVNSRVLEYWQKLLDQSLFHSSFKEIDTSWIMYILRIELMTISELCLPNYFAFHPLSTLPILIGFYHTNIFAHEQFSLIHLYQECRFCDH